MRDVNVLLLLFFFVQEDADQRPFVSRVINKLANYDGGVIQNTEQEPVDEPGDATDVTSSAEGKKKKKKKKGPTKKVLAKKETRYWLPRAFSRRVNRAIHCSRETSHGNLDAVTSARHCSLPGESSRLSC
jgi:hypothetical protein